MSYDNHTMTLPDGSAIVVPPYVLTPEQDAERVKLLSSSFFLVKQGSLGEIFRCGLCQTKHAYLTLRCVEQPFSGLDGGLVAFYKVMGRPSVQEQMRPDERARLRTVGRVFRPMLDLPELGQRHPAMSGQMAKAADLGDRDAMLASVALGILEPLSKEHAQRLLNRINLRNGKLTVPGLNDE